MVDLRKLCELFHIEVGDDVTEDEMVALLVETVDALLTKMKQMEGELAATRNASLSGEMATLKMTVSRLEEAIRSIPGAETELQARCRKVYGRG